MDELLERAFAYRETELWKKIGPDEIFAIMHSDQSIGYCCITGIMEETIAVAVYPGKAGITALRRLSCVAEAESKAAEMETLADQDCVACSFVDESDLLDAEAEMIREYCSDHGIIPTGELAWPQFMRIRPYCAPWFLQDETDKKHLGEAFDACLDLTGKLKWGESGIAFSTDYEPGTKIPLARIMADGSVIWEETELPNDDSVVYPADVQYNEPLAMKVKKSKNEVESWICDIIVAPQPMLEDKDLDDKDELINIPYFPLIHMMIDSGGIVSTYTCKREDRYDVFFVNSALEDMHKYGKPREIIVTNLRTYMMYVKLADYLGIRLKRTDYCLQLDEMEEEFYDQFDEENDSDNMPDITDKDLAELKKLVETTQDFSGFSSDEILAMYMVTRSFQLDIPLRQARKLQNEFEERFGDT